MEEDSLYQILTACYEDTLKSSIAWSVYQKVLDLCQDGDLYTITNCLLYTSPSPRD